MMRSVLGDRGYCSFADLDFSMPVTLGLSEEDITDNCCSYICLGVVCAGFK